MRKPIVRINDPFIGRSPPVMVTFICRNIPSVRHAVSSAGFTLIELLVTLTVLGIIAALAAPAMGTFIKNQRITTQTNEFIVDLNFARSEAIKRAANAGVVCVGSGCASNDYTGGRRVFVDEDDDGAFDAGEEILRERPAMDGSMTLQAFDGGAAVVVFDAQGLTVTGNGQYAVCDDRGAQVGRLVEVSVAGQTRAADNPASCS